MSDRPSADSSIHERILRLLAAPFKSAYRAVGVVVVFAAAIILFLVAIVGGGTGAEEYGGGYFHLSQGSELFPYDFFPIIERADSTELFATNLERFGLMPDPADEETNPFGLPVGLSVAKHEGSPLKMVGMTCAACHSGQIEYNGRKRDLIGAPGMFDPDRFFDELADAAEATLRDREKRFRFLKRYVRKEAGLAHFLGSFEDAGDMKETGVFEKLVLGEIDRVIDREIDKMDRFLASSPKDSRHIIMTGREDEVPEEFEMEDVSESFEDNEAMETAEEQAPVEPPSAEYKRPPMTRVGKGVEALTTDIRIFVASIHFLRNYSIVKDRATSAPGNGRVDAFGKVRNMVLPLVYGSEVERPTTAPVSFPHLWDMRDVKWLHWNGNTDSVMERNVLEALGSGAIVDLKKFDSTVNFENLYELEKMTHAFTAPVWPEDLLPPIDRELAAKGKGIFDGEGEYEDTAKGNCISCHDMARAPVERDLRVFPQFRLADMETDPNHAENFNRRVDGGHGEFYSIIQGLAQNITGRYYTGYDISPETQATWEDHREDVDWRSPIEAPLPGRPLTGVWATAPFLHNGSVPTLYDLLLASDDRPTTFTTGTFRFDPVKVGYETAAPDAIFVFDVNAPAIDGAGKTYPELANGNSNRGHEFGAGLSDEDRWALVEFMKTL